MCTTSDIYIYIYIYINISIIYTYNICIAENVYIEIHPDISCNSSLFTSQPLYGELWTWYLLIHFTEKNLNCGVVWWHVTLCTSPQENQWTHFYLPQEVFLL